MNERLNAMRAAIQADPARRRRVECLVQRLERRQRRLAIARRRERIAAQPRVGDRLWWDANDIVAEVVVTSVDDEWVQTDEREHDGQWWRSGWLRENGGTPLDWPQMVRRARMTQEGSAHE